MQKLRLHSRQRMMGYSKACCRGGLSMSNRVVVDLLVEDRAHEELLKPLLQWIAHEEQVRLWPRVRTAKGGHGRAKELTQQEPREPQPLAT